MTQVINYFTFNVNAMRNRQSIKSIDNITTTAIHQPSFEYTDSILTSWHKNQVHTLADVQKLDAAYSQTRKVTVKTEDAPVKKNAFNNFNQRSYDYDKLEELLLTTSLHG